MIFHCVTCNQHTHAGTHEQHRSAPNRCTTTAPHAGRALRPCPTPPTQAFSQQVSSDCVISCLCAAIPLRFMHTEAHHEDTHSGVFAQTHTAACHSNHNYRHTPHHSINYRPSEKKDPHDLLNQLKQLRETCYNQVAKQALPPAGTATPRQTTKEQGSGAQGVSSSPALSALAQAEVSPPLHLGSTLCADRQAREVDQRAEPPVPSGQVGAWMGGGRTSAGGIEEKLRLLRLLQEEGEEMLAAAGH